MLEGYFLLYNFSVVGTLLIFWTELGCGPNPPRVLQQAREEDSG